MKTSDCPSNVVIWKILTYIDFNFLIIKSFFLFFNFLFKFFKEQKLFISFNYPVNKLIDSSNEYLSNTSIYKVNLQLRKKWIRTVLLSRRSSVICKWLPDDRLPIKLLPELLLVLFADLVIPWQSWSNIAAQLVPSLYEWKKGRLILNASFQCICSGFSTYSIEI
jgi:hypothetical protein